MSYKAVAVHKGEYNSLQHFGILGMKWGVRRYQNPDGSYTAAGKKRYGGKDNADRSTPATETSRTAKENGYTESSSIYGNSTLKWYEKKYNVNGNSVTITIDDSDMSEDLVRKADKFVNNILPQKDKEYRELIARDVYDRYSKTFNATREQFVKSLVLRGVSAMSMTPEVHYGSPRYMGDHSIDIEADYDDRTYKPKHVSVNG